MRSLSECAHYVKNMGFHNVRTHWMHHVCTYIKNWPEDGSLEPKHVAKYALMIIYIYLVFE
jgi:hypothetical protein